MPSRLRRYHRHGLHMRTSGNRTLVCTGKSPQTCFSTFGNRTDSCTDWCQSGKYRILPYVLGVLSCKAVVLTLLSPQIGTGFENWAGGSGTCRSRPEEGLFRLCPTINAPHPLPWGSAQFIGLGFSVFATIILCERFGSPIM